jgi:prephenate dehydrogenase/chorismate mutase/prephenate dehydrogenase
MNILIIGSRGRMGSTLCNILSASRHTLIGIDTHNKDVLDDLIDRADLAIIATPFDVTVEYLDHLSSRVKCIELTSAKSAMHAFRNRVISLHPLFGPWSYGDKELRNIVFISDISPPGSLKFVRNLFKGFSVIAMTADEHDDLVSKIQVLPYILSLLADQVNADTHLRTRSKRILDSMAAICREQNRTVLMDTITRNPYSIGILKAIEEKMTVLGGELTDRCSDIRIQH